MFNIIRRNILFKNIKIDNFPHIKLNTFKLYNYRISTFATSTQNEGNEKQSFTKLTRNKNTNPTKNNIFNEPNTKDNSYKSNNNSDGKTKKIYNQNNRSDSPSYKNQNKSSSSVLPEFKIDEYLKNLQEFSKDFSQVTPIKLDRTQPKDTNANKNEQQILEKLSNQLNSERIREKGAEHLIDTLLTMYKQITGRLDRYKKSNNFESYLEDIKYKTDPRIEEQIKQIFSQNEVIDAITLIIRHISDLKTSGFEKLINILVKIKYTNGENWKIILRQYILYLTLLNTSYQPLTGKHISQILYHIKHLNSFITYSAEVELLTLLDKALKDSVTYLLKNINEIDLDSLNLVINSISKLGLLDEENTRIIEKQISPLLDKLPHSTLANIQFCVFKNRCGSESFHKKFENINIKILDDYESLDIQLEPHIVTMIIKSFYAGFRINKIIFQKIENVFINNYTFFEMHQCVAIAHCLVSIDLASEKLYKKMDEILLKFEYKNNLTELLTFQILFMLMKKNEFSVENIRKYIDIYKKLMNQNQVKPKQAFALTRVINVKLSNPNLDPELREFLLNTISEFKTYGSVKLNK